MPDSTGPVHLSESAGAPAPAGNFGQALAGVGRVPRIE